MGENLREKGKKYEQIAGAYLENKGYKILEYNFRCRYSEIDIVASKDGMIVFCEVKYRKRSVSSLEAVHVQKQKRISMAAMFYMSKHRITDTPCRFDVIGIEGERIIHVENAFDYMGV